MFPEYQLPFDVYKKDYGNNGEEGQKNIQRRK
jgi:hypothetical protein